VTEPTDHLSAAVHAAILAHLDEADGTTDGNLERADQLTPVVVAVVRDTMAETLSATVVRSALEDAAMMRAQDGRARPHRCGLCGHDMALRNCGYAAVTVQRGELVIDVPLCHTNDHDCYRAWTIYKRRPATPTQG